MKFLFSKYFRAALIIIPNLIVALFHIPADLPVSNGLIFALGSGLGAATFTYVFYYLLRVLTVKKKPLGKYTSLGCIAVAYLIYYLLLFDVL